MSHEKENALRDFAKAIGFYICGFGALSVMLEYKGPLPFIANTSVGVMFLALVLLVVSFFGTVGGICLSWLLISNMISRRI